MWETVISDALAWKVYSKFLDTSHIRRVLHKLVKSLKLFTGMGEMWMNNQAKMLTGKMLVSLTLSSTD